MGKSLVSCFFETQCTYAYKASDGSGFGDMQFATDYNNGITYAMNALSIGVGSGRVTYTTGRVLSGQLWYCCVTAA